MNVWHRISLILLAVVFVLASDPADARKRKKKAPQKSTGELLIKQPEDKSGKQSQTDDTAEESDEEEFKNPYKDQLWSLEDVMRMCANSNQGPRSYKSCVDRNERRVGRIKTPYDNIRIGQ